MPARRATPRWRAAAGAAAATDAGFASSAIGASCDGHVVAVATDHRDRRPDLGLALLDDDPEQNARDLRLDLLRHLVGVELVERLVCLDRVALRLQPADDRSRLHALSEPRELDFGRHYAGTVRTNSSSATESIRVIMLIVDEARRSVARDGGRLPRRLGGRPADPDGRAGERPSSRGAGSRPDQRRQSRRHARLPCAKRRRPSGKAHGAAAVRAPRSRPHLVPHRAVEAAGACCTHSRGGCRGGARVGIRRRELGSTPLRHSPPTGPTCSASLPSSRARCSIAQRSCARR